MFGRGQEYEGRILLEQNVLQILRVSLRELSVPRMERAWIEQQRQRE